MASPSGKRRKFLRSIIVELDCGHERGLMTGFYRITERRLVSVMAGYIGSGVACDECREVSMNDEEEEWPGEHPLFARSKPVEPR